MAFKTQKEMEQVINVSYPKQLALSLKMQENEFVQEMQKLSIIKLLNSSHKCNFIVRQI